MADYTNYKKLPYSKKTRITKSETAEVEVEIDLYDIVEFVDECEQEEADIIIKSLEESGFLPTTTSGDPIYEEVLKSDSWESRDKIAFLKTIFEKMTLEEMKNKLL